MLARGIEALTAVVEKDLAPQKIVPLNSARPDYVREIASDMKSNGWNGRRILVEEVTITGGGTEYFAWTGSNRIAAARVAELKTVPCVVLTSEEADKAFVAAGYEHWKHGDYDSWRSAIRAVNPRAISDKGRQAILEQAGLEAAAEIVREEVRHLEERRKR